MKRAMVAIALLVLSACGSSGDSDSRSEPGSPSAEDRAAFVDDLMVQADEQFAVAGVALLAALDRGYELTTIEAAVGEDRFSMDGVVAAASGDLVEPEGPDTEILVDKAPLRVDEESFGATLLVYALRSLPRQNSGITVAELGASLERDLVEADVGYGPGVAPPEDERPVRWGVSDEALVRGRARLIQIARLVDEGYSAEQIIDAVVFGTVLMCEKFEVGFGTFEDCILDGERPAGDAGSGVQSESADVDSGDSIPPDEPTVESSDDQEVWSAEFGFSSSPTATVSVPGMAVMTRRPGTNDFDVELSLTYIEPYGVDGECTQTIHYTYTGVGQLYSGDQSRVQASGTQVYDWTNTCGDPPDSTTTADQPVAFVQTEAGLEGTWIFFDPIVFASPVPTPV